ncbi:hypothetical protein AYO38_02660 [bacterium SCGC AG-212-C10]|nr:hypothetical protein AYO38_02660 [bacterium SCGC AG-212-C10]
MNQDVRPAFRPAPAAPRPSSQGAFFGRRHQAARLSALTATLFLSVFAFMALDSGQASALGYCPSGNVCVWNWMADDWELPTAIFSPAINQSDLKGTGINDNVRFVWNRSSKAVYFFQDPGYETEIDSGLPPFTLGGPTSFPVCIAPNTAKAMTWPMRIEASAMLFADEGLCGGASIVDQKASCAAGMVCAYVDKNLKGPMFDMSRTNANFSLTAGLDDSISSIRNRSSHAVIFFRDDNFEHDLEYFNGYSITEFRAFCVPAGQTVNDVGYYNDRFSSMIESASAYCD